jgi:hypothetical protein
MWSLKALKNFKTCSRNISSKSIGFLGVPFDKGFYRNSGQVYNRD